MKINITLCHNIASSPHAYLCCNLAGTWSKSKKILQSATRTRRPWWSKSVFSSNLGQTLCFHRSTNFEETIEELGVFLLSRRRSRILGCFSLLGSHWGRSRLCKEKLVRNRDEEKQSISLAKIHHVQLWQQIWESLISEILFWLVIPEGVIQFFITNLSCTIDCRFSNVQPYVVFLLIYYHKSWYSYGPSLYVYSNVQQLNFYFLSLSTENMINKRWKTTYPQSLKQD